MNNKENLKKKLIETIDLLQEILDIANEFEDDKMSECKESDLPKKPCMEHWSSGLSDRVWEKFREDAIAVGDLH